MKKAISYIRLSSQEQIKGAGLSRQLEMTRKYAEKNGLNLIENLQDIGLSGYKGHHTEKGKLGVFLEALKNGEIEDEIILLVESLDRLSREKLLTAFNQFSNILQYGIEIHTILDGQVYTEKSVGENPGQIFASIGIMMRAHNESQTKSDRLVDAWNKKREEAKHGKILTKMVPAWIDIDTKNNKFMLKPKETEVLQEIFNLSLHQGMGIYSLTRYLNDNLDKYPKFTTHFNKDEWSATYIKKLMNSPTVYGAIQLNKKSSESELIENYYPAAISKETFLLNRKRVKERTVAVGRTGLTYSNVFKGLLKCSSCGGNIIHRRKNDKDEYLTCTNRLQHKKGCQSYNWNYKEFEKSFFEMVTELDIQEIFKKPDEKSRKVKLNKSLVLKKDELNQHNKEKDTLVSRMATVDDEILLVVQENLKKRILNIKKIKDEIDNIETELMSLKQANPKKTQQGLVRGLKELLSKSKTKEEKKQIRSRMASMLREIIDSISIVNNPFMLPEIYDTNDLDKGFITKYWERRGKRSKFKTLDEFLSSQYGIHKLSEWERYYIVKFRNGEVRYVRPSRGTFLFQNLTREFDTRKRN